MGQMCLLRYLYLLPSFLELFVEFFNRVVELMDLPDLV